MRGRVFGKGFISGGGDFAFQSWLTEFVDRNSLKTSSPWAYIRVRGPLVLEGFQSLPPFWFFRDFSFSCVVYRRPLSVSLRYMSCIKALYIAVVQ